MILTRCAYDIYHGTILNSPTYAGDQKLFAQAMAGGYVNMWHKLSQGMSMQDPMALGRLKYAAAAGVYCAGYHFMTNDPLAFQVAKFMHMAGQAKQIIAPAKLLMIIDNEPTEDAYYTNGLALNAASAATDQLAAEFAQAVFQATGQKPLAYGDSSDYFSSGTIGFLAGCQLIIAEYGTDNPVPLPPGWRNYTFHQDTDGTINVPSTGPVPGIGAVDQSLFAGSLSDLAALYAGLPA
jgi:GH25 family lysozyme M1 (1,4-beta-N-acetylmuramidase)